MSYAYFELWRVEAEIYHALKIQKFSVFNFFNAFF